MRSIALALACAAGFASAACPTWIGQAAPYAIGTVVTLNGTNYKVVRTLDNGWIAPTDTWFWASTTETCGTASGSGASTGGVSIPTARMFLSVEGTKQGRFKGESSIANQKDKSPVWGMTHSITSPRDLASGQASGKRQHGPLTVTKAWGAATPQFFQALVTNEVLKSVLIEHYQTSPEGLEEIRGTIKLVNATVSNISRSSGTDAGIVEAISFTYQRIELEDVPGKTMAVDDWTR